MRVIAGSLGGRRLVAPRGGAVRPTSDRVRGAIANMLEAAVGLEGARVADVCCGTGALGIEVLSRGAAHVEFVDSHRRSIDATRTNLQGVGLLADSRGGKGGRGGTGGERVTLTVGDAVTWAQRHEGSTFDVVLVDPPYAWDQWDAFLDAVAGWARMVLAESDREVAHPAWDAFKVKRYGGTVVSMLLAATDREEAR